MDGSDFDEEPAKKAPRKKAASAKKAAPAKKGRTSKVTKPPVVPEEDSDEDTPAPPPKVKKVPAPSQPPVEETGVASEEEISLFDPPPMPPPMSQSQAAAPEPKGPVKRLVIHQMALIDFKSYAGRQVIGPFHKSFSSIVGPNGSGKSNTIDALLFVFGYRATKMRQGKISELIHNSAEYPDLEQCSVEVHFREIIDLPGPDAFEIVPGSDLSVARYAYKNNNSKYTINGRGSNYKEVQALLKGRGIDLDHNRFLILQGEVESIAQMKPKGGEHDDGLLEYLEDIIGTSQYKEPIDEALVELENLQEVRREKINRVHLVERELSAMNDKKAEAEAYLRMQNEFTKAQSRLFQYYIWTAQTNEKKLEAKIVKLRAELETETANHQDDITHVEELEEHYKTIEVAFKEVETAAAAAQKMLADNEKKSVNLEELRKHAASQLKKVSKTTANDQSAKATAERTIEDNSAKIEKHKKELVKYEADLVKEEKALEAITDSLRGKTQGYHDKIEIKQRELQPWGAKINGKKAEIDVATSERDALTKKAEDAKIASEEANGNLERLNAEHKAKISERDELKAEKEKLVRDGKAADQRHKDAINQVQTWKTKASISHQKVVEARSSQAENKSQGKVLDGLTKMRDNGQLEGFHGRLGSLGKIDDKYDVAITTACGSLGNMVVDTVEQGQACIEYLRRNNVGRASFMVLEKLRGSEGDMRPIPTPENVPRLFDLITPVNAKFAPAFYKAISNTLVAETLDQANRIAFGGAKRWRVVTLGGQLIDTSGTMGGGGQPQRGGMNSKFAAQTVKPDVLRGLERESEDAQARLQEAQKELQGAEADLERIRRRIPDIDMSFQKLGMDIETGKNRITEAEKRVKDLRSTSRPDAKDVGRIAKLNQDIETCTAELEDLEDKSKTIRDEIQELKNEILKIGGSRLLMQKSTVEGIQLHITVNNDELTKAEVAKAKAERDLVKLTASIENNAAVLENAQAEVDRLKAEIEENRELLSKIQRKVDTANAAVETHGEKLDELKQQLDEKNEEIQQFRKLEAKLKGQLKASETEIEADREKEAHWLEEQQKLELVYIAGDEEDEGDEDEGDGEGSEAPVKPEPEQGDKPMADPDSDELTRPGPALPTIHEDELARYKERDLVTEVELLDENLKSLKPNLNILKEHAERTKERAVRVADLEALTAKRDAQKTRYDQLRKQRLDEFMAGFNLISLKLKEMYQMITLGGNAELELVDSMDPFSEGIIFSVMPPKKSWKNISNLSGGEKTLSSLALVFALHVFKPTPLYFMDEIDAALDFRNVSIVANYIKDRTKNAQFIIISLRNDMFELSHRLIGIYKTSNMTKSVAINNQSLTSRPDNQSPTSRPVPQTSDV
ncbi:RecF/RecN/SMC [Mycena floridula]|nr:RecF/RecN/SMC [Mycena floridula]